MSHVQSPRGCTTHPSLVEEEPHQELPLFVRVVGGWNDGVCPRREAYPQGHLSLMEVSGPTIPEEQCSW